MSRFWRLLFSIILIFTICSSIQSISANERMEGYALKQPVHVYESTSREADVLKSYNYNHKLIYYPYSADWYRSEVILSGIRYRGYIHKEDVGHNPSSNVSGISINTTKIYSSPETSAEVLKTYRQGSVLKYRSYKDDWYVATVYVNGKRLTGYIYSKDVETAYTKDNLLKGIGIKRATNVYSQASTNSKVHKSYKQGQILQFRSFTKNWYEATVYVNGERKTGYIHRKDVELIEDVKQEKYKGIGTKRPTNIYSLASTNSKVQKSYNQGQILQFRSFTKNWYEATVYVNGKRMTGYIHNNDVEIINNVQESLQGIALKQPTRVYTYASKSSKALKNYKYGHILKFTTFSNNWYEATVYLNGKPQKGYIAKNDINTNLNSSLQGYAISERTPVYSGTSRNSAVLKSYNRGHLLKYKSFNSNWFIATVYVDGKPQTGYIHTADISPNPFSFKTNALAKPTKVYSSKTKKSRVLKSYSYGTTMKLNYHNKTWYEATVYLKGKPHKGYVHVNDVGDLPPQPVNQEVKQPSQEIDNATVPETVYNIPILMYHHVGENPKRENYGLYVSEANFREQMSYLKSKDYTLINFDELPNLENIEKPIIVTFDDGNHNNMIAYEILKELKDETFNPKATIFVIGSRIDSKNYLSSEQIKEISDSEIISIQGHTMTHPFFNDKETKHLLDYNVELFESKSILEQITGKEVTAFAYPYGSYNNEVIEETKKYYDYAVTTVPRIASTNDSLFELPRVRVSYDTTIEQFIKSIGDN